MSWMRCNIKKLQKIFSFKENYNKSYSQSGEDIIVERILSLMSVGKPSYLDIGAHDPVMYNKTYLFYEKGSSGVNVEPDPECFLKLASQRPRDVNLNVGVRSHEGTFNYYVMTSRSLNTFSVAEAKRYESYGKQKVEQVVKVEVVNVNEILSEYFDPGPNFVSLDVEGLEMEILESFDFEASRPEVFCIETLTYTEDNTEEKVVDIIEYMKEMDYMVHSDTYINTIFVDRESWLKRGANS